ncbi:MAG TPA: hypothetical protein VH186_16560 [Chloroflexia bacterium]|nr:hypothetical protein [Chloroflexia bacterium]
MDLTDPSLDTLYFFDNLDGVAAYAPVVVMYSGMLDPLPFKHPQIQALVTTPANFREVAEYSGLYLGFNHRMNFQVKSNVCDFPDKQASFS